MDQEIINVLRKNGLSITEGRKRILELFLRSGSALAHHDIEMRTRERFDRVTVYRTLQAFMDKGIIHTIPSSDNSIRYALCKGDCEQGHHHDDHIHFKCKSCGATICLDEVNVPPIRLPRGYKTDQVEVIVSGLCKQCN